MIQNDAGLVALQHYNSNPKTVKTSDGTYYTFTPQHNVSLAWVKPEHVNELNAMQQKVCCGKMTKLCFLASHTNVNLWTTGNR